MVVHGLCGLVPPLNSGGELESSMRRISNLKVHKQKNNFTNKLQCAHIVFIEKNWTVQPNKANKTN